MLSSRMIGLRRKDESAGKLIKSGTLLEGIYSSA